MSRTLKKKKFQTLTFLLATSIFLKVELTKGDFMNQLFVFLIFALILISASFIQTEHRSNISLNDDYDRCEKQLDEGIRIISTANKERSPCWLQSKKN